MRDWNSIRTSCTATEVTDWPSGKGSCKKDGLVTLMPTDETENASQAPNGCRFELDTVKSSVL